MVAYHFELSLHTQALVLDSWNCSFPAKLALLHTASPSAKIVKTLGKINVQQTFKLMSQRAAAPLLVTD